MRRVLVRDCNPGGAFARADHVFRGTVVSVEMRSGDPNGQFRARLAVDTVWKGDVEAEMFVYGGYGSDCLVSWQERETYVVFARSTGAGELRASHCDGTGLVGFRPDPAVAYGAGTPVAPASSQDVAAEPPSSEQQNDASYWLVPAITVLLAVALAVAGLTFARRVR